jgi:hypothetical protein
MATGKERILFKRSWVHVFNKLEDHEAGQLIKHLLSYCDDQSPTAPNRLIEMVFEPMKQELKQDLRRWNEIVQQNKDKAAKRWGKNIQQDATASNGKQQQVSDADIDIELNNDMDMDMDKKEVVVSSTGNRVVDAMIPIDKPKQERKVFKKPAKEDVENYFIEKGLSIVQSKVEAETFMNHYTSNGWKVGKNPMVDWKATVRTWLTKRKEFSNGKQTNSNTGASRLDRFGA